MLHVETGIQLPLFFQDIAGFPGKLGEFPERGAASVHAPARVGCVNIIKFPVMGYAVKNVSFLAYVEGLVKPSAVPRRGILRE